MSSPCILCLSASGLVRAALWCLWCLPYPEESKGQISVISIFIWHTQPPKTQSSTGSFSSILGALPRRHRAWVSADWTLVLLPGLCGSSTGLQLKGYSSSLKQLSVYVYAPLWIDVQVKLPQPPSFRPWLPCENVIHPSCGTLLTLPRNVSAILPNLQRSQMEFSRNTWCHLILSNHTPKKQVKLAYNVNVRARTKELLKRNIEELCFSIEGGKSFLNRTRKTSHEQ